MIVLYTYAPRVQKSAATSKRTVSSFVRLFGGTCVMISASAAWAMYFCMVHEVGLRRITEDSVRSTLQFVSGAIGRQ